MAMPDMTKSAPVRLVNEYARSKFAAEAFALTMQLQ